MYSGIDNNILPYTCYWLHLRVKWSNRIVQLFRNVYRGKRKMQAVGLEPTRANTLRPERSTLDHSVTLASKIFFTLCYF